MKFMPIYFASLTLTSCVTHPAPDTTGLIGMTEQQATEALRVRGLNNVSRIEPPSGAKKPSYLYAEHRDLLGWPCPPRQWIAVYFEREGGRVGRVENGVATDCSWP